MDIGKLQRRFAGVLTPASKAYAALMRARALCHTVRGPSQPYRSAIPVVSVGNIAWGGTGKTPVVDYLLTATGQAGLRTAVLTRGYKASPPQLPFPVCPDERDASLAGDEPLLLAQRHPEATVIVDPKRSRAAAWAENNLRPDLLLLDDGMQHLGVARDLDIVLLRPEDLLDQWNRVIPAGSWREGASALQRAHAFCLKADPALFAALSPVAEQRLASFGCPLFSFYLEPSGLERLVPSGATQERATGLTGVPYTLVCGTANPDQVTATASAFLGYSPAETFAFPDHYPYTAGDVRAFCASERPVVCTGKDAVKLAALLPEAKEVPLWVLTVAPCFGPALFTDKPFDVWWQNSLHTLLADRKNADTP